MRSQRIIGVLGLSLVTATSFAHAAPGFEPRARAPRMAVHAPDSLRIAIAIAEAERFAVVGRFAEARRRYRAAAEEQRTDGASPAHTFWLLASSYFADGDEIGAARVLGSAADAAAEFGDPELELRANFEAAVLYANNRRADLAMPRLERARRLLKSPAISNEQRKSIERRMGGR